MSVWSQFLAVLFFIIFSGQLGYCIQLSDFKQSSLEVELFFDTIPTDLAYTTLAAVPKQVDLVILKEKSIKISADGKKISIPINPKNEPIQNEYSIFIFADGQWLELVRQSSAWLSATFSYKKPDGYTILGRHTINRAVEKTSVIPLPSLKFNGKPDLSNIKPLGTSKYLEIKLATGLLHQLWSEPIKQGPVSESYDDFLKHTFNEKLEILRSGKFAVMCQGFRDLFLHASYGIPKLKVRAIEALNYAPPFNDLISYGHSTAEIWIEGLGKWVVFDPWLGVMVAKKNGEFVGAFELQKFKDHPEYFVAVPVISRIPRMYKQSDNKIIHHDFYPKTIQLSGFDCKGVGCTPGYIEYFNNLSIHASVINS